MFSWSDLIGAARTATIPAPALRAVTLAQWALESGRGASVLSKVHGNYAGLKWRPEMTGFATKILYQAHDGEDFYCEFTSPSAFIAGYWQFIGRPVYNGWQAFANDPMGYLTHLKSRGYAADSNYVNKIIALIPEAEGLLGTGAMIETSGASAAEADVDRPSHWELGESLDDLLPAEAQPDFVTLSSVKHKFKGKRPNGLEGAIVHYDAGRSIPTKGPDDLEWGAKNTLVWGQTQGFAYATISRSGKIYLPGNMDWESWGSHAGESECPVTKRTAVSQFLVGFEVNSPGFVYPTPDADVFVPWFDAVREKDTGKVILNAKGQATVANPNGQLYKKAELRIFKNSTGNIKVGAYVPYTDAQFEALVKVMLWLKRTFKPTFRLDYVFGHDEVAPKRKLDPGGSLGFPGTANVNSAVTMAKFRAALLKAWADQQDV